MKVKMVPGFSKNPNNGIAQTVNAYYQHLPAFGIELVEDNSYDLLATHAGALGRDCDVCHCHGLYWTADYDAKEWEYKANINVIQSLRNAQMVTVPSEWVAKTLRRDMHIQPVIVPHGIEWDAWQNGDSRYDYVLYNKNRQGDVCDATPMDDLAKMAPDTKFVATFGRPSRNVKVTGVRTHDEMKKVIQSAGVYLATTKETWGISTLEALASGVPVLGYDYGGTSLLVESGVNGYLAQPGNVDDLLFGLRYCEQYNEVLGSNARELARLWTWERAVEMAAQVYHAAYARKHEVPTVAIVIPVYNYAHLLERAMRSAMAQDYDKLQEIIIVNDGSTDNPQAVIEALAREDGRIRYIHKENGGVATARNAGIQHSDAKYICCLDADDEIAPTFISTLVPALEADPSLGVAFTSLNIIDGNGRVSRGGWPQGYDYNAQVIGQNQVPTCCLFRREAWRRTGGYRQRYAPNGCGTEDAEFWLRIGAIGYGGKHVTEEPLFFYHLGGRSTQQTETVWLDWHPWTKDEYHPFASQATPEMHSHPVHQKDNPAVSIIIPVGPNHEHLLVEALDSLEAQTIRDWEVIVVWNAKGNDAQKALIEAAYPFATFVNDPSRNAAAARNAGAELATAPFLLFLDADDWLLPEALEIMLGAYAELDQPAVIYAESLGIRAVDEKTAREYEAHGELLSFNNGVAMIHQPIADYNYDLAITQPFTNQPYFWCYVSSLHLKAWHDEIGGFDEDLGTWEDWDYWIRMAKAGYDFVGVHEPCLVYQYDTGSLREAGKDIKAELREVLTEKHKEVNVAGCSGCGKRTSSFQSTARMPSQAYERSIMQQTDGDFVMCEYTNPRGGSHGVIGNAVFDQRYIQSMVKVPNGWSINYGYHSQGDRFLVHKEDIRLNQQWFTQVQTPTATRVLKVPEIRTEPKPISEPQEIKLLRPEAVVPSTYFDFQTLPGVNEDLSIGLNELGAHSLQDVVDLGETITSVKGIGPAKAEAILAAANEKLSAPAVEEQPEDVLEGLEAILGGDK